jgi:dTDP-4-amino-4,6-dideoxygalactose transaminase
MTSGEGGVITTNSDEIDETLRMIRTHGEKAKYSSLILGTNYRMSEIEAAIADVQLDKLPSFLGKRRQNAQQLTLILKKSNKLLLPCELEDRQHSWYLYTARLKDGKETERNSLMEALRNKGIGAEAYYVHPVHQMPFYRENFGGAKLPETDKASKQVFSLPIHPMVTQEQVDFIGKTVLSLI